MSGFFTGADALKAVGNKTGKWNWALVGANEIELPLAGGGAGGVEELQACLKEQGGAVLFGLIRLSFPDGLTKYAFVLASKSNARSGHMFNAGAKGTVSAGSAITKRPAFERVLRGFAPFTLTIEVHDPEDFNVEDILARLAKTSTADGSRITPEAYRKFLANQYIKTQDGWVQQDQRDLDEENLMATELPQMRPEVGVEEEQEIIQNDPSVNPQKKEKIVELALPHEAEEKAAAAQEKEVTRRKSCPLVPAMPDQTNEPENKPEENAVPAAPKQEENKPEEMKPEEKKPEEKKPEEKKPEGTNAEQEPDETVAKAPEWYPNMPFAKGQTVFVFSAAEQRWIGDGLIVELLEDPSTHQGFALPAGAIKVQYSEGKRAKWIPPEEAPKLMKVAPTAPPTMVGPLLKETHSFLTEWHQRHFEISRGLMKWWMSADEFKNDAKPNTTLTLKGVDMQIHETTFRMRTGSSKGVVYAFQAGTAENLKKWVDGIREHAKYCNQVDQVFRN